MPACWSKAAPSAASADAAIYVGSSRDIVVRNNEVFNNVAGIEIENCTAALVTNNRRITTRPVILVFVLPNNPLKDRASIPA